MKIEDLLKRLKDIKSVFQYLNHLYVSKIIYSKVISSYYNNPFMGHFRINKTKKLMTRNNFSSTLHLDLKGYIKRCIICLA